MVKVAYTCLKMTNKLIATSQNTRFFEMNLQAWKKKNQNPPLRFVILYIE